MAKRYRTLGQVLQETFGERVYKVSLDAGFSCPNKDGTISDRGCIFCDTLSFSPDKSGLPLVEQLRLGMEYLSYRYKARKFLAYFQPNSNSYASAQVLEKTYRQALSCPAVVGLSIATRPDLVPDETLDLLQELSQETYIWVEYGLQTMHESTLKAINRGHGLSQFVDAVERTKRRGLKVCAHVILGLPGETKEMMLATAAFLSQLGVDGVKIHQLYVPRGTPLETMYKNGLVKLLELHDYVSLVVEFLENLAPEIVIHRLVASAAPPFLVAPEWTAHKMKALNAIEAELDRRNTFQGSKAAASSRATQG